MDPRSLGSSLKNLRRMEGLHWFAAAPTPYPGRYLSRNLTRKLVHIRNTIVRALNPPPTGKP